MAQTTTRVKDPREFCDAIDQVMANPRVEQIRYEQDEGRPIPAISQMGRESEPGRPRSEYHEEHIQFPSPPGGFPHKTP